MGTKVTSLETQWNEMLADHGDAAFQMWASAIGQVMDNTRTKLANSSVFSTGREKAGTNPKYITTANLCKFKYI